VALPPRRRNLVPGSLGDDLAFELSKGEENVQHQAAHRGGLLRDRDKGHLVAVEDFHELGKVEQRTAEAVHFVDEQAVEFPGSRPAGASGPAVRDCCR
jgi:hypothetical protein